MKKLLTFISTVIVSVAFLGVTASAQQQTCDSIVITNTGAGSNNQGVCTVVTNVTAICNGTTYVLSTNDQSAITGTASSLGNTSGGPAITGNATNSNGQSVVIGAGCGTSTPTAQTGTPGKGSAGGGAGAAMPAVLPNTASSSVLPLVAGTLLASAIAVAASRLGLAAYRRHTAK